MPENNEAAEPTVPTEPDNSPTSDTNQLDGEWEVQIPEETWAQRSVRDPGQERK